VAIERGLDDRTLGRVTVGLSGLFTSELSILWQCPGEDPRTESGPISVTLTTEPYEFQWGTWLLTQTFTESSPPGTRDVSLTLSGGDFVPPD
jgi:hypothetical protein